MIKTNIIRSILFSVIFIFCGNIYAQVFAPIGAKWHYTQTHFMSSKIDYTEIISVGDTLINSILCKILIKTDLNCSEKEDTSFVYSDSGKVYWYNQVSQQFTLLYDFTAIKGDSWEIFFDSCFFKVKVDSTSTLLINGNILKVLYITDNLSFPFTGLFSGKIIERMGHTNYMFPYPFYCNGILCDGANSAPLRCYEDSLFGFFNSGVADSCNEIITDLKKTENNNFNTIEIYPNPFYNSINLDISSNLPRLPIRILNHYGIEVYNNGSIDNRLSIPTEFLADGIYFLQINDHSFHVNKKIIKLHQ